jgi:hypothetical protein
VCLVAGGCARSPLAPPAPDLAPPPDLGPLPAPICDAPPDAGRVGCDDGHWRWRGPKPVELGAINRFGWRAPDGEAWIVSDNVTNGPQAFSTDILHWDGARFSVEWRDTALSAEGELRSIWGSSRDDLWAVGDGGLVLHSAGDGCWERLPAPAPSVDLVDVKGRARDDAWAIGAAGTSVHWDGIEWHVVPTGVTSDLVGLAVVDGAEWIISTAGEILRWDGASWGVDEMAGVSLKSIWADSATDAWVVGDYGTMLHWNGTGWISISPSTTSCSTGWSGADDVSGNAPDDVCIFCDNHDVHWDGSAFKQEPCGVSDPSWKQLLSVEDFMAVSVLGPS